MEFFVHKKVRSKSNCITLIKVKKHLHDYQEESYINCDCYLKISLVKMSF